MQVLIGCTFQGSLINNLGWFQTIFLISPAILQRLGVKKLVMFKVSNIVQVDFYVHHYIVHFNYVQVYKNAHCYALHRIFNLEYIVYKVYAYLILNFGKCKLTLVIPCTIYFYYKLNKNYLIIMIVVLLVYHHSIRKL